MKNYALWTGRVIFVFVVILIFSTEVLNVLSDLSSIFFFMFALINIIIIGTIIAVEIAKNLKLEIIQKELDTLQREQYYIEYNNDFSITFNLESVELQKTLKAVQQKISTLQEAGYENL